MPGLYISNRNAEIEISGSFKQIDQLNYNLFREDRLDVALIKKIIHDSNYENYSIDIPGSAMDSIVLMINELFTLSQDKFVLVKDSHLKKSKGIVLITNEIVSDFKSWYMINSDIEKSDFTLEV